VDTVIRAFAEIKQRFPDATLELVGQGSLKPELDRLVNRLGLSGVRFLGRVDHHEIIRLYRGAHVFINGSRLDNFPNAVLEALAAETLIATTDVGGIKHIVENEKTALLSPVDDAHALAANVVRLFQDQQLAASLLKNVHAERQKYSWARLRSEWVELYLSLL
jgi:glycosyltransferase involved in cell wall biosynthesis